VSGLWDQPGVPHKGWRCIDADDLGETSGVCGMCGREEIRYVHVMEHPEYPEHLEVGCVCAEKMANDYEGPRQREARLKNKAARRSRWLTRKWRVSRKGNLFLNTDGFNIIVFPCKQPWKQGKWGFKVDDGFGNNVYASANEAKIGAFEALWERLSDD